MSNRLAILFPLANPVWGFQSLDLSVSPAVPAPNQGLAAGFWFSEHVYGIASIADANGDPTSPDFDVFDTGETFRSAEIGYRSSHERQFLDNVQITRGRSGRRDGDGRYHGTRLCRNEKQLHGDDPAQTADH